jgi:hypothetical protein
VTLNVNGLNYPIKGTEWQIERQDYLLPSTNVICWQRKYRLRVKGYKKLFWENWIWKQTEGATVGYLKGLISW